MAKIKAAAKPRKARKAAPAPRSEHHDEPEHKEADRAMQAVLDERKVEDQAERIDQWVSIECPHCGEGAEIHVTAEEDGQSLDQDCAVCCRTFVAHVEIDEGEAQVNVEAG